VSPSKAAAGALAAGLLAAAAFSQSRTMEQGAHKMELMLERLDGSNWHTIDPALVLAQGDRVRFRFRTTFDGYLYVTNLNTSGKYEQLFPLQETGEDNRIAASQEYKVPATSAVFKIGGPAGYETVYWLVTPAKISGPAPKTAPIPAGSPSKPLTLTPRCDDAVFKARGDCIDHSAGLKLVPRGAELPKVLAQAAGESRRDLLFMRQQDKAVVSSPQPLTGPVIYEFRLAHK
jgi:hypothetical protein